ncbi:MAG: tetratricopeptide repeat protein [Gammaproteobacteria bacterium]|nr:tetratricopeptide repeat protein [Gammaproteobacteria bacterium]
MQKNESPTNPGGTAPGQQGIDFRQALDQAMSHLRSGRPAEAEGLFRRIIEFDPNQPVALHLLGVL